MDVRREWSAVPPTTRTLLQRVDGRIHLFGAEEGWIEIGHSPASIASRMRMVDTDGDGFFDAGSWPATPHSPHAPAGPR